MITAAPRQPHRPAPSLPAEAFVETDDGPVRYVQAGQGRDVVLVHGAMTCLEDMVLGPFDALAAHYRVTALDRPGHGKTGRPRLHGSPLTQALRVREAVRGLGLENPILVGHSFGAALAMDWALEFPQELRGVVLISPIVFPEIRLEHLLFGPRAVVGAGDFIAYGPGPYADAWLLPLLWRGVFAPQPMPERFRRDYPFALGSGPSQLLALGEEAVLALPSLALTAARLPSCPTPVRIIAGEADIVASPHRHARRMAALLPNAEAAVLPGQGHMLHHFAIDEVVQAVRELDRQGPA